MISRPFACALPLLLAFSAAAAAQVPAPPPRVGDVAPGTRNLEQLERERHMRHGMQQRSEDPELVERVAALVEEGRCEDARRMARGGGDRALSRRVSQICREGVGLITPETPQAEAE